MSITTVQELELRLAVILPDDYREFLVTHQDRLLDPPLAFKISEGEPLFGRQIELDLLSTAEEVIANADNNVVGDPERGMIIIGGTLMGGYLYICLRKAELGCIYFRAPYVTGTYFKVADSFQEFLSMCSPGGEGQDS